MIASIRGRIVARGTDHVVVETGGIGYRIFVPRHPEEGEVLLHTHQVVREDAQLLFGFETPDELALFELLIGVSGVGPKAALALLGISRPADVAAAIAGGDAAALAKAPGVGKKTAERLIVDLRAKVGSLGLSPLASGGASAPGRADDDEAQAALRSLGYTPTEAANALAGVPGPGRASTEERLAAALRSKDPR